MSLLYVVYRKTPLNSLTRDLVDFLLIEKLLEMKSATLHILLNLCGNETMKKYSSENVKQTMRCTVNSERLRLPLWHYGWHSSRRHCDSGSATVGKMEINT